MRTGVTAAAFLAAAFACAPADAAGQPGRLPQLCVDRTAVSVSGVSSGGFLANQLHTAHSRTIMGAAIIAAGPYACAGDGYPWNTWRALTVCSDILPFVPFRGPPDPAASIDAARAAAASGSIDDLAGLAGDRVFLFSGQADTIVPTPVVDALATFYDTFAGPAAVKLDTSVDAAHAMITADFGNACTAQKTPFINDCHVDVAGEALQQIYGSLAPRTAAPADRITTFDQSEFVDANRTTGLAAVGYAYVPQHCAAGAHCRLHVALHGCAQTAAMIGDAFYRHAGYNAWAEANDIVVLYPQAAPVVQRVLGVPVQWPNPKACWDWWGFTGDDYATRTAPQIAAITRMIDRLEECPAQP